jgi:DNA-binding transcriptional ArsR family regulator
MINMTEKYLNLNLNDENASRVAEILANKTAKKILSIIAESEKELSETDISLKLKIPLNTVDYNVKKLLSAGLIEKSSNFFWSVKGKKIPTFKLANKKIIISTKSAYKGILPAAFIFGAIGFAANVFSNIFRTSRSLYSRSFEKISESGASEVLTEKAPRALDSASNEFAASSSSSFNFLSLFHNAWIWILAGVLIGIILFFVYKTAKRVKGGYRNNKL